MLHNYSPTALELQVRLQLRYYSRLHNTNHSALHYRTLNSTDYIQLHHTQLRYITLRSNALHHITLQLQLKLLHSATLHYATRANYTALTTLR